MDGAPGSHREGAGPVRKEAAAEVHARGDGGEDGAMESGGVGEFQESDRQNLATDWLSG